MMCGWWAATVRRTNSPSGVSSEAWSVVLSFSPHTCFWGWKWAPEWQPSQAMPSSTSCAATSRAVQHSATTIPRETASITLPTHCGVSVSGRGCGRGALKPVAPHLQQLHGWHAKHAHQRHKHSGRLWGVSRVFGGLGCEGSAGQCHLQSHFSRCSCTKPRSTPPPARGNHNSWCGNGGAQRPNLQNGVSSEAVSVVLSCFHTSVLVWKWALR